ncbi:MAG: hypothetical protein HWE22_10415 [Flavobacteriales bacterium]|nr:hypothetical protein [Flavobacteriales bacterium]
MENTLESEFKLRKQKHLEALNSSYQSLIEAAHDKTYAARVYSNSLFGSILDWKDQSLYFERVLAQVAHLSKLNPSNVIAPLIEKLPTIKEGIYDTLPLFNEDDTDTQNELRFLELTDIELADHLAQFIAALDLSKKYASRTVEESNKSDSTKNKKHRFTRNQQLLAIYYTLKSAGIEPRKTADMTNYSRFVHLLSGVGFTKVENDIFYSKVQKLPNLSTDPYLKKDLEYIRDYFLKIDAHKIVEEIDLEIKNCSNNH